MTLTQAAAAAFAACGGALDLSALTRAMWLAPHHIAGTLLRARLFHVALEKIVRVLVVGLVVALGIATALR